MPVLGLYIVIRLLHDLLKDWQVYITEPFNIHTNSARRMFAQASQQFRVLRRAVHKVNSYLIFSWIKTDNCVVAFASTVVFVMIRIEPDSAHIPQFWFLATDALHHFGKRSAIFYGLFIAE